MSCTAYGCKHAFGKDKTVRAHSFPLKDKPRLQKWLVAMMRREDIQPTVYSRICGKHFLPYDYYPYSRELLKTAVPSCF